MSEIGPAAAVDAYMAWWALAGVDSATGEAPVNWLKPVIARPVASLMPLPDTGPPATLEAFHAWLADADALPEAEWAGPRILPTGTANTTCMIVSDMPELADAEGNVLMAGEAGQLFDAMLAAIGLTREDSYIASLAVTRPPGGRLNEAHAAALATRMRHHIALVAPRRVLLMGDQTKRALMAADTKQRQSGLGSLNHADGTVDCVAVRHPRFLLKQPEAKAECWHALQYLIEDLPS